MKEQGKINLHYTLDHPNKNWNGYTGFVNKKMMSDFPQASNDHLLLGCGPVPMMNDVERIAEELGYNEDNVYFF